jgi:hypothetical protein
LTARPGGSPVALHAYGLVPPVAVSVVAVVTPVVAVRLPGFATAGAGPLLQVNYAASVTVTVVAELSAAVWAPVTTPVVALIASPAGSHGRRRGSVLALPKPHPGGSRRPTGLPELPWSHETFT